MTRDRYVTRTGSFRFARMDCGCRRNVWVEALLVGVPCLPQPLLDVPGLTKEECKTIVVQQLREYRKRLTNEQLELLLDKAESSKPLYLLTCCEELRYGACCSPPSLSSSRLPALITLCLACGCHYERRQPSDLTHFLSLCLLPQSPSAVRLVR